MRPSRGPKRPRGSPPTTAARPCSFGASRLRSTRRASDIQQGGTPQSTRGRRGLLGPPLPLPKTIASLAPWADSAFNRNERSTAMGSRAKAAHGGLVSVAVLPAPTRKRAPARLPRGGKASSRTRPWPCAGIIEVGYRSRIFDRTKPGELRRLMFDTLFWYTGLAARVLMMFGVVSILLVEAHDRS
jgi:hypothetical protein